MGRVESKPDSVYASNPGFLAEGVLQAYATGSIGQGELCVLHESGAIRRADPSLPWSILNCDGLVPVVIQSLTTIIDVPFASTCTTAFSCGPPVRLQCGFFVVPVHPRGSIGVGFCIRAASGAELGGVVSVSSDTCTTFPECVPLPGGNFHLIWHTSATLKCQLFNQ